MDAILYAMSRKVLREYTTNGVIKFSPSNVVFKIKTLLNYIWSCSVAVSFEMELFEWNIKFIAPFRDFYIQSVINTERLNIDKKIRLILLKRKFYLQARTSNFSLKTFSEKLILRWIFKGKIIDYWAFLYRFRYLFQITDLNLYFP